MKITEEQIEELSLTPEQLKATKKVYSAMKAAGKLGVHFWDNYGTLSAFNSKKVEVPIMKDMVSYSERNSETHFEASDYPGASVIYYENLKNFFSGNADDEFYAMIK